MRKANEFLMFLFITFIQPLTCVFLIIAAYNLWVLLDDELGAMWLNIACLLGTIFLVGFTFNMLWALISWIGEKIHFYRLDRYYEEHPEEEQKNREALAKDFEELAKIIREEKNNDEH